MFEKSDLIVNTRWTCRRGDAFEGDGNRRIGRRRRGRRGRRDDVTLVDLAKASFPDRFLDGVSRALNLGKL